MPFKEVMFNEEKDRARQVKMLPYSSSVFPVPLHFSQVNLPVPLQLLHVSLPFLPVPLQVVQVKKPRPLQSEHVAISVSFACSFNSEYLHASRKTA